MEPRTGRCGLLSEPQSRDGCAANAWRESVSEIRLPDRTAPNRRSRRSDPRRPAPIAAGQSGLGLQPNHLDDVISSPVALADPIPALEAKREGGGSRDLTVARQTATPDRASDAIWSPIASASRRFPDRRESSAPSTAQTTAVGQIQPPPPAVRASGRYCLSPAERHSASTPTTFLLPRTTSCLRPVASRLPGTQDCGSGRHSRLAAPDRPSKRRREIATSPLARDRPGPRSANDRAGEHHCRNRPDPIVSGPGAAQDCFCSRARPARAIATPRKQPPASRPADCCSRRNPAAHNGCSRSPNGIGREPCSDVATSISAVALVSPCELRGGGSAGQEFAGCVGVQPAGESYRALVGVFGESSNACAVRVRTTFSPAGFSALIGGSALA